MTVATTDDRERPSCRVVLLKEFSREGFTFYTNYNSYKRIKYSDQPSGFPASFSGPQHWGGYRVKPYEFEFWQGRQDHLTIEYGIGWKTASGYGRG